jgi:excinuclease ABC subunit C
MDIKEKIKALPASPGVYLMRSSSGEVIYVGKAINLRKRVSSYFRSKARLPGRTAVMAQQVADVEYIQASTEAEALIYENSLIKEYRPKYNVALKDGKSYPMLKLTLSDRFPRLSITRQKSADGTAYYGPYADAKLLRKALIFLQETFPLRKCAKPGKKVCLNYHIKQCLGPCEGLVDEEHYNNMVTELKFFLAGKRSELLDFLSKRMARAAAAEAFEEAAKIKARIEALGAVKDSRIKYGPGSESEELKKLLGAKGPLDTIEAFDISNIRGQAAVGSMIYFRRGKPDKNEYRRFRIKTVDGIDDYAMMREIVRRRYARALKESKKLPDAIIIDGGKGHLFAALEELKALGIDDIPVAGIAKEFEHIYVRDKKEPIILPKESKALHLLQRMRDEAHRFAISYHKRLFAKKMFGRADR